jgi:hypothetical protein
MSIDTNFILKVFRHEYQKRLNEVIGEADVFDDSGNVMLSQDLKVRHKPSGLEYTIKKIEGDQDGEVKIYMRPPEAPRFKPADEERDILGEPKNDTILGEQDPAVNSDLLLPDPTETFNDEPEEVVFVIDQKEFEKDYEVD